MRSLILEVVECNDTIRMTFQRNIALGNGHAQFLSLGITIRMRTLSAKIEIIASCKEGIIFISRHTIAVGSHVFGSHRTKIAGRCTYAFIIKRSSVVFQRITVWITGLVLIPQQRQQFLFRTLVQVSSQIGIRRRVRPDRHLVAEVLYIATQVILTPPGSIDIDHRKPPITATYRINLPVASVFVHDNQMSLLHTSVCLRVIWFPATH